LDLLNLNFQIQLPADTEPLGNTEIKIRENFRNDKYSWFLDFFRFNLLDIQFINFRKFFATLEDLL